MARPGTRGQQQGTAVSSFLDIPFTALMTVRDGKMTAFRVYFDQLDMLSQLGLADSAAAQPAAMA